MEAALVRLRQLPLVRQVKNVGQVLFGKYLLLTNTAVCVGLSGAGDLLQQRYEIVCKRQKHFDGVRSRHICSSALFLGPAVHYYYIVLDWLLPGTAVRTIAKKLLVDQLVFSPIMIASFLITMGWLQKSSKKEIIANLQDKGTHLFAVECVVWPPAQAFNFFFLPTRYRVLYDNSLSLGFDVYYSYVMYHKKKHKGSREGDIQEEEQDADEDCKHEHSVIPRRL